MWELPSGERREQVALDAGVVSVATAGSRLLSQDREGSLRLWDVGGGGFVESERLPTGCNTMCRCAVREQDERLVAVMPQAVDGVDTGLSSELDLWDFRAATVAMRTEARDDAIKYGMVMALALTGMPGDRGAVLLRGCENGSVGVFDLTAGRWRANEALHAEAVLSIATAAKGRRGLSGSADKNVVAFSVDASEEREDGVGVCRSQAVIDTGYKGVAEVALRPDEKIFGVAGWDHRVRLYGTRKLEPLAILKFHKESVNSVAFAPDNTTLASASKDGCVAVWGGLFPGKHK